MTAHQPPANPKATAHADTPHAERFHAEPQEDSTDSTG